MTRAPDSLTEERLNEIKSRLENCFERIWGGIPSDIQELIDFASTELSRRALPAPSGEMREALAATLKRLGYMPLDTLARDGGWIPIEAHDEVVAALGQSHSPATVELSVYESAVRGRAEFRRSLRELRDRISADAIAVILAEHADPKPENIPYLAVKIAESIEHGDKALATASQPVDREARKCRQCLRIGASLSLALEVIKRHGLNPPDEANKIMDELMSTTPPPDRAPVTEEMIRKASAACRRLMFENDERMPTWEELMRKALEAALAAREAQKGKGNE